MSFLPANYEVPKKPSRYMKFEKGPNKFRILSDTIIGFEYWDTNNKPVRTREYPEHRPTVRMEANGSPSSTKHFWAMIVWDYKDTTTKILQINQSKIQETITDLYLNNDWGDPKNYDITVTRTGEGFDTKYTVMPSVPKDMPLEAANALVSEPINLEALYDGKDPFAGGEAKPQAQDEVEANV